MTNGKKLGHIIDIVIDLPCGKIKGLVLPINSPGFSIFKQPQRLFICFNQICKIGEDIILVELYDDFIKANTYTLNAPKK